MVGEGHRLVVVLVLLADPDRGQRMVTSNSSQRGTRILDAVEILDGIITTAVAIIITILQAGDVQGEMRMWQGVHGPVRTEQLVLLATVL